MQTEVRSLVGLNEKLEKKDTENFIPQSSDQGNSKATSTTTIIGVTQGYGLLQHVRLLHSQRDKFWLMFGLLDATQSRGKILVFKLERFLEPNNIMV